MIVGHHVYTRYTHMGCGASAARLQDATSESVRVNGQLRPAVPDFLRARKEIGATYK